MSKYYSTKKEQIDILSDRKNFWSDFDGITLDVPLVQYNGRHEDIMFRGDTEVKLKNRGLESK